MILEGIVLGTILYLSFILSWMHFPSIIKKFTKNHPWFTDMLSMGIAYVILTSISKSLIAAVGAIVTGLLVNFTIIGYLWREKDVTRQ